MINEISGQPVTISVSQPVTCFLLSQKWDEPTVVLGGAAILISVVSLIIVWRQFRFDKQKFKKEMFEKRYAIYEDIMVLIGQIRNQRYPNNETLFKIMRDVVDAHLILPDIVDYLEEIRNKAMDCKEFNDLLQATQGRPPDDEYETKRQTRERNMSWFNQQVGPLNETRGTGPIPVVEKFKKYIQIKD
jgi:hypothetical protein